MSFSLSAILGFDSATPGNPAARVNESDWTAEVTAAEASVAPAAAASSPSQPKTSRTAVVGTQFEAMFLRQVLEDMLPKNASSVFGAGTAGGIWRSMLADNLANSLAEQNILGLAKVVANEADKAEKSKS